MSQRPIETIRDGKLSASIWQNSSDNGNLFYSVTFERVYTGEDEQPHSAASFSGTDLLKISLLATKAYDRCQALRDSSSNPLRVAGVLPVARNLISHSIHSFGLHFEPVRHRFPILSPLSVLKLSNSRLNAANLTHKIGDLTL